MNARNESSGTPVYMAPEILFKKEYSYESDFYALGVIVYELAMGRRPYEGKNRA
jgi:serum/glucocorticoid-regulated kinase 2